MNDAPSSTRFLALTIRLTPEIQLGYRPVRGKTDLALLFQQPIYVSLAGVSAASSYAKSGTWVNLAGISSASAYAHGSTSLVVEGFQVARALAETNIHVASLIRVTMTRTTPRFVIISAASGAQSALKSTRVLVAKGQNADSAGAAASATRPLAASTPAASSDFRAAIGVTKSVGGKGTASAYATATVKVARGVAGKLPASSFGGATARRAAGMTAKAQTSNFASAGIRESVRATSTGARQSDYASGSIIIQKRFAAVAPTVSGQTAPLTKQGRMDAGGTVASVCSITVQAKLTRSFAALAFQASSADSTMSKKVPRFGSVNQAVSMDVDARFARHLVGKSPNALGLPGLVARDVRIDAPMRVAGSITASALRRSAVLASSMGVASRADAVTNLILGLRVNLNSSDSAELNLGRMKTMMTVLAVTSSAGVFELDRGIHNVAFTTTKPSTKWLTGAPKA